MSKVSEIERNRQSEDFRTTHVTDEIRGKQRRLAGKKQDEKKKNINSPGCLERWKG